jgi:hypothetical protein
MKYLPRPTAQDTTEWSFLGFCHMEKTNDQSDLRVGRADRGSRIQALAAWSSDAAARRAMKKTHTTTDCVRAPNVGAYATAPYSVPPCMPNTLN